jgi:RNA polymerase sigma-70 factor (ECF subfamily)
MDGSREIELVARARDGDESALSELFEARRARLVRMVELRIDPSLRRRLDPADVVQEVWLDLSRRLPEWRAQESLPFSVWVRLMTSRALVDAQRRHLAAHKRDALREVPIRETRTNISAVCCADAFLASNTSPTRAVERDEIRARVITALEELDGIDREIVALRHFEGLSNEEAAAELSIEPAAASKRFVRALLRLRPALASIAPGPASDLA